MTYAFSDGSPYAELAVLGLTIGLFSAGAVLVRRSTWAPGLDGSLDCIAWFTRKRLFFVDDPEVEQRRIDLIRIVLGGMAFMRNWENLATGLALGDPATITASGAATLLCFLLAIGFVVPLTAAILCLTINTLFDNISATSSLSSLVLSMTLIPMALAPAGRTLSVDALILRSPGAVGRLWRAFYDRWGTFNLNRAALSKLLLLLAYTAISLSSGLLHLQFDVWRMGLTNTWMFLNPTANPHFHGWMWNLYEFSPWLFVFLTRASAYGTLVFQLGMLPLLFLNRWTRMLIVLLELGFMIGSVSLLALSWLGWNQLAMWALLFWSSWWLNVGGKDSLQVLYDDHCASCDRRMRILRTVDLFNVIHLRPLSENLALANSYGISPAEAVKHVRAIDRNGGVTAGYAAYLKIMGRVFLLTPFWPILALGRIAGIGPSIYRFVAARWIATLGVGTPITVESSIERRPAPTVRSSYNAMFLGVTAAFLVMLGAYACRLPVHYLPGSTKAAELSKRLFGQAPVAFGLWQINAFNFGAFMGQGLSGQLAWRPSAGDANAEEIMYLPPVRANISVSDILFYQVVVGWNRLEYEEGCFKLDSLKTSVLERPGLVAVLRDPRYAHGEFSITLRSYTTPTLDDLREPRFVPLIWSDLCTATFPANTLEPVTLVRFIK